jgi:hypothetical protein
MNPLNAIEKWISEHGSAAILRDHLALLKEKITSLESENFILKTENAILKKENLELKGQINNLNNHAEIAKLPNQKFPKPGLDHDFEKRKRK